MNRSCKILLMGWFLIVCGCGTPALKEYTSGKGRFVIRLPAGQREEVEQSQERPIGTLTLEQPNGTYQVAYQDVPGAAGESPEQLEQRLDEYRDDQVANSKASQGRLRGEKKITLAGPYPGLEFVIEFPPREQWVRSRIYFVDGRLYQVNASGKKDWVDSRESEKVLDSFRVQPR
jgi:hypothetical protein